MMDYKELAQFAEDLGSRFIQRWDIHAKQMADGSYVMVREALENKHLVAHLKGEMTLGTYVLDTQSQSRLLGFYADDVPDWRRL